MEPPALPQGRQGGMEPQRRPVVAGGAWSPSRPRGMEPPSCQGEAGGCARAPWQFQLADSCFPQDPSQMTSEILIILM